jgi:hypothetical protein
VAVAPGSPVLPPELNRVLDAGRQSAVRAGHGTITPWHLVQVLAREHPDVVNQVVKQVLGEAIVSEADLLAARLQDPGHDGPLRGRSVVKV